MAQYQITSWRELPSMVVARDDSNTTKVQLAPRFQEAIDEAAMRLGETSTDDYLAGWTRGAWTQSDGEPADVAAAIVKQLEAQWTDEAIATFLNSLTSVSG